MAAARQQQWCTVCGFIRSALLVALGGVGALLIEWHWYQLRAPDGGPLHDYVPVASGRPVSAAVGAVVREEEGGDEGAEKEDEAEDQEEEEEPKPAKRAAPAPPASGPAPQYCTNCCNDGYKFSDCFDVEACAKEGPSIGKYALVLSHFGHPNARFKFLPFIKSWREQVLRHPEVEMDILLLITSKDAQFLQPEHHQLMKDNFVKIVEVEWNVPPNMMYKGQSAFNHFRDDGTAWCGPQDLMRLHAFSLEGYDAVAYYDSDIEFQGDVFAVFPCAARGKFITTGGGIGVPLNIGFFAVRPDPRLMEASKIFARDYNYSKETGWGESGWAPSQVKYAGGECGQGFLHTLLYKEQSAPARAALKAAGLESWSLAQAVQIDKCVWNYQTSFQCPKDFDCSLVRAHHKPKKPGKNPKECLKSHVKRQTQ